MSADRDMSTDAKLMPSLEGREGIWGSRVKGDLPWREKSVRKRRAAFRTGSLMLAQFHKLMDFSERSQWV